MTFEEIKSKLNNKIVGIAGCGGLGSNCAVALARVGIGKLIIADFDIIVESNLNRQYFFYSQIGQKKAFALRDNILNINPNLKINAFDIKLNPQNIPVLFSSCDIIVEAFDLAEMKEMIIETVLSELPEKIIVSGVGLAGWGKSNLLTTKQLGKLYLCGDFENEVSVEFPPLAPRVGIVANMQANQVLELILEN